MSAYFSGSDGAFGSYVLGIFLLVIIGVGFGILQDYGSSSSSSDGSSDEFILALATGSQTLKELDGEIAEQEKALATIDRREAAQEKLALLVTSRESTDQEFGALAQEVAKLREDISALGREKKTYRKAYNQQMRASYLGKTFESLRTQSGKTYKKVLVTGFDEVGMAITHASGPSRIRAMDLPEFIRQEFDFDVSEIEEALKKEAHANPAPVIKAPDQPEDPQALLANARADLVKIEARIADFQRKRNAARREASKARIQARGSKNRSSPNGLDTWEEWARKQEALVQKYTSRITDLAVKRDEKFREAYPSK